MTHASKEWLAQSIKTRVQWALEQVSQIRGDASTQVNNVIIRRAMFYVFLRLMERMASRRRRPIYNDDDQGKRKKHLLARLRLKLAARRKKKLAEKKNDSRAKKENAEEPRQGKSKAPRQPRKKETQEKEEMKST